MTELSRRDTFLIHMYDQMLNDINRHIVVVWQSIGVLVGAFALFALAEKKVVPVDWASTLVVLISGWSLAHIYDASYWYNRNLAIIANIEKQFLLREDLHDVHYYFGAHRPNNRMIAHLRIQHFFGVSVCVCVLAFQFFQRSLPILKILPKAILGTGLMPYIAACVVFFFLHHLRANRMRNYQEFLRNSPGLSVDTEGIEYGNGHGFTDREER